MFLICVVCFYTAYNVNVFKRKGARKLITRIIFPIYVISIVEIHIGNVRVTSKRSHMYNIIKMYNMQYLSYNGFIRITQCTANINR
jgi:hypothetical protein